MLAIESQLGNLLARAAIWCTLGFTSSCSEVQVRAAVSKKWKTRPVDATLTLSHLSLCSVHLMASLQMIGGALNVRDGNCVLPASAMREREDMRTQALFEKCGRVLALPTSALEKKSKEKSRRYTCRHCGLVACTKNELWAHGKVHLKKGSVLECPHCAFVTKFKHHLDYHLSCHNGLKPFCCTHPNCGYRCINKSMLKSHMKSHVDSYQYRCADCDYATKYAHSLKLHGRKYGHRQGAQNGSRSIAPVPVQSPASNPTPITRPTNVNTLSPETVNQSWKEPFAVVPREVEPKPFLDIYSSHDSWNCLGSLRSVFCSDGVAATPQPVVQAPTAAIEHCSVMLHQPAVGSYVQQPPMSMLPKTVPSRLMHPFGNAVDYGLSLSLRCDLECDLSALPFSLN